MNKLENNWTRLTRASLIALTAAVLVGTGAGSLLEGSGVEAKKRGRTAAASNEVGVEEIRSFSNPAPIAIASNQQTAPSTIEVSGFGTTIADVNVSLANLTHPAAGDLDILLVGPGGQTALIMSDAGGPAANDTLVLDDQGATQLPSFPDPLVSGTFQPTNYEFSSSPDTFAPPAPTNPSSGSSLSVFNGTNPNGTWRLFIKEQDNVPPETGSLAGGWSLTISGAEGVPTAAPDSFQAQVRKTLTVAGPGVLGNDSDPNGDALTAILAGPPKQGAVTLQPDGSFTYRAKKKAKGTDSFTYFAQDASGLRDVETVTIQIKKAKKKKGKK